MKFDYQNVFELMQAYLSLGRQKGQIVSFLFETDVYKGSYTDLTEAIGQEKKNMPNIRKALKFLDSIGVVRICYEKNAEFDNDGNLLNKVGMEACFLIDGWMKYLLRWYHREMDYDRAVRKNDEAFALWQQYGCPEAFDKLNNSTLNLMYAYRVKHPNAKGYKAHRGIVDIEAENMTNFWCDIIFDGDPKTIEAIEAEPDALKKMEIAKASDGKYLIWS